MGIAPSNIEAQKAQEVRDLRNQISDLSAEDEQNIVFKKPSPRRMTTVYSMLDGEPLPVPASSVLRTLEKRLPGTREYMFTARQEDAPEYKLGSVKCFLHPESAYRTSGILAEAGISMHSCPSAHHPSKYAMEEVAKAKHKKQWQALQAYLADQERTEERAERRQQLDATLALAGKAVGKPAAKPCVSCGEPITGKLADHACEAPA